MFEGGSEQDLDRLVAPQLAVAAEQRPRAGGSRLCQRRRLLGHKPFPTIASNDRADIIAGYLAQQHRGCSARAGAGRLASAGGRGRPRAGTRAQRAGGNLDVVKAAPLL